MIERDLAEQGIQREFGWWVFRLTIGLSIVAILTGWAVVEVLLWTM